MTPKKNPSEPAPKAPFESATKAASNAAAKFSAKGTTKGAPKSSPKAPVAAEAATPSAGKGHATPKRKEQEAARKRGMVLDVKTDAKERRARDRARREAEYVALRTGDERNMPVEHRGPEKRFIRDYIDARTSIGEFLLPVALIFVVASLVWSKGAVGGYLVLAFYVIVLGTLVDTVLMMRRLKRKVIAKFGATKVPRGFTFYSIARALNIRRFRTPKPVVKRGEYPV